MQKPSNDVKRASTVLRGGLLLLAAAVLGSWLWGVVAEDGAASRVGAPLRADDVLTAVAAAAALSCLGWLALGVALELLALTPGAVGRAARLVTEAVTPRLLRRVAGVVLGVGVVAGLAPGPAVAGPPRLVAAVAPLPDPGLGAGSAAARTAPGLLPSPAPDPARHPSTGADGPSTPNPSSPDASMPDPGWVPTVPTVRTQPDVRVLSRAPRSTDPTTAEVVVRRGDSLWSIAARHLGPEASDVEIAAAWPEWFAANRELIGDDPDLLLPGQVLRAPEVVGS